MTIVRIIRDWDDIDPNRQTPRGNGVWDEFQFTSQSIEKCDYAIVLNGATEPVDVRCPPVNIWSMCQEPPVGPRVAWHANPSYAHHTITSDPRRLGDKYIHDQPAICWRVGKKYDELSRLLPLAKNRDVSWITSNLNWLTGHRKRLRFLDNIRSKLEFDLFGRGFNAIDDKWDGLALYRYSIAVENYANEFYWSEKLADCYLAWCMPIYYGCTRITEYFPAESMIQIDIRNPESAIATITEAIANKRYQRNLDAIAHARDLILNRYQLFPFLANHIREFESKHGVSTKTDNVTIEPRKLGYPFHRRVWQRLLWWVS